ncbi:MAG: hypothetical protein IT352_12090 [Gemmatimonadales bacterium]|nr:hypothetical protein [Gemmatimonadales bacterium]
MMRAAFITATALFVLGCDGKLPLEQQPEPSLVGDTDYALTVSPVDFQVHVGSLATFTLENRGASYLSFNLCSGAAFERLVDGKWSAAVEAELTCPDVGNSLDPGGTKLGGRPARVSPGTYRIRVALQVLRGDGPNPVIRRSPSFTVIE